MKSESDVKREIVGQFKARGWYARRIEDKFAVGVLDLVMISPEFGTVFAEVKIIRAKEFGMSPRQHIEAKNIINNGGEAVLIGYENGDFYVHDPVLAIRPQDCVVHPSIVEAMRSWFNDGWKNGLQTTDRSSGNRTRPQPTTR